MDVWIRAQYRKAYCNKKGKLIAPTVNFEDFRKNLVSQRPDEAKAIARVVKELDNDLCSVSGVFIFTMLSFAHATEELLDDHPKNDKGQFLDADRAQMRLQEFRPDLVDNKLLRTIVKRIERNNAAALRTAKTAVSQQNLQQAATASKDDQLYQWIHDRYFESAFTSVGFVGWKRFQKALIVQRPDQKARIAEALEQVRQPGHDYSLQDPLEVQKMKSEARRKPVNNQVERAQPQTFDSDGELATQKAPEAQFGAAGAVPSTFTFTAGSSTSSRLAPPAPPSKQSESDTTVQVVVTSTSLPLRTAQQVPNAIKKSKTKSTFLTSQVPAVEASSREVTRSSTPDFSMFGRLMAPKKNGLGIIDTSTKGVEGYIKQAPLLSGSIVEEHSNDLVPQYGVLGYLSGQDSFSPSSQIFLNTNVPVSTFICGVQGSGKSHTTSCIIENAVIPSKHLGQLQSPVSTLVFSYGEWTSGGAGFSISEATYLATPSKVVPGHQVKRVTVLTSPSNLAINKLYQRHPNVRIVPFKLKAKTLDISALRTLMAIDEKSTVPLYMAKVESILRSIAANSKDGSLDYTKFKKALELESFDATQSNMLDMRLNLLESFLDLTDKAPQPDFLPGEITIMDLSDAFISPNTACILFKLGLERFLQNPTQGKLVVLDEAHKYMINTPGSKLLTNHLTSVIRLQRHKGARIVISTQEPTVSTDLIALCSVTIIHRFTSPAWYSALKKHISAMDDDEERMHEIEGLETGEALVYAPNAVLGKKEDGSLIKATGRLLKVNVRNRVTLDGGESIMAI